MRTFGTQGSVNPEVNYVVSRSEELADFVGRIKIEWVLKDESQYSPIHQTTSIQTPGTNPDTPLH